MFRSPSLIFAAVFVIMMALTQFLTYQQYKISREKQQNELIHEAAAAKDRFRNILFSDLAAANTLAIIYKQYGVPDKFDSIASQILNNSRYAQALQITENGVVKNIYPDVLYKGTIGKNVNADTVRKAEELRAAGRKDIYFAGPRRLRFGDTGILGKVPIIVNNHVKAIATVLTRMAVIKKELEPAGIDKKKFAYQLLKVRKAGTLSFPLSDTKPADNGEYIDIEIPEGDWVLRTGYGDAYIADEFPYELSGMGVILSIAAALLTYRKTREPYKLKKIIDSKTAQSNKTNMELNLLNQINDIILAEQDVRSLYNRACRCIVESGGYELAWIFHGPDKSAAADDAPPGYPANIKKVLREPGTASGPTAGALCTGETFADNDTADAPLFLSWIESETKHGAPALIALPLEPGNNKTGALCIYAKQVKAFDASEANTLKRLAANLSIAVQNIQNRTELVESENRFRGAFEDSAIGMGLTSVEENSTGRWIKVNRSLCEMLGYTEDELLSLTFMQITHPEDLQCY